MLKFWLCYKSDKFPFLGTIDSNNTRCERLDINSFYFSPAVFERVIDAIEYGLKCQSAHKTNNMRFICHHAELIDDDTTFFLLSEKLKKHKINKLEFLNVRILESIVIDHLDYENRNV